MSHNRIDSQSLCSGFRKRFGGRKTPSVFFAPGRINIIGEHLDYNGGFVLPCALKAGTWLAIRPRHDDMIIATSQGFSGELMTSWKNLADRTEGRWWNYPLGVFHEFRKSFVPGTGFELMFAATLPTGAGLSSSASIEVVTAYAVNEMLKQSYPMKEIVLLARRAENNFVGVQCGIMDQYAVAFGKKDHALLINTKILEHEYIPVNLGEYCFLIADTDKPRKLDASDFNERFVECRQALKTIQRLMSVNELAEATMEEFVWIESWFPDEKTRKRAKHIISENERVQQASHALENADIEKLALLINESYASSRDNFEVSCFELDALIEAARFHGSVASRISGAGFGGCTLNVVKKNEQDEFRKNVMNRYEKKTGLSPRFYSVDIEAGVRRIAAGD
jgi:galactokinase